MRHRPGHVLLGAMVFLMSYNKLGEPLFFVLLCKSKPGMLQKLETYFIGHYFKTTDNVFEHARIKMTYRFALIFFVSFWMQLLVVIAASYNRLAVLFAVDIVAIVAFLLMLRKKNIDFSINFFFTIFILSSLAATIISNTKQIDKLSVAWTCFSTALSALLQRGTARVLFCCVLHWLQIALAYYMHSFPQELNFAFLQEQGTIQEPMILIAVPIILGIYAFWTHTQTIQKAKEIIVYQKQIVEEKQKEMIDSITYARRIQRSLLPTDKYIERNINKLKN
jgi:hypothetical protein